MFREIIAIFRMFNITSLGLHDLKVMGNGHILARELGSWSQVLPSRLDKAVTAVAHEFVQDCIKEIDELIYSKPAPEGYTRTKKLKKGHSMRRVSEGVYVVSNLVPYALPVHDGYVDRGGNYRAGRPWMDLAALKNDKKYKNMIDEATSGLFK